MTISRSAHSMRQSLPRLLDRFRDSWQNHDIAELSDLFADSFEYIIDGKIRFRNKVQLRNYWCKNKLRQRDLSLVFFDSSRRSGRYSTYFTASFYHPVSLLITVVTGKMSLECDASGKIIKLEEYYDKIEKRSVGYSFDIIKNRIISSTLVSVASSLMPLLGLVRAGFKFLLSSAFFIGLVSVVYVNFVHSNWPIFAELDIGMAKSYTLYWFAAAYLLQQFIPMLRKKIDSDLYVRSFDGDRDLEHMSDIISGSDNVYIVSGDFSFVDSNKKLESSLRDLAFSGKLHLISYKSRETLVREMSAKSSSNEIMLKLIDNGAIRYNFPVKSKITIVENGGNRKMLFRFKKELDGKNKLYMGFIKHSDDTASLLSVVERLIESGGGAVLKSTKGS